MLKTDQEKLAEVDDLFNFILKVQDRISPQVATTQEAEVGEGRKGVLMVRGGQKWVRCFEVRGGRLVPSNNVDGARTVVAFESIESFRKVCSELLAGRPGAFSRARARGEVRVEGEYAIRDLSIFNELLSKVGRLLSQYGVKV